MTPDQMLVIDWDARPTGSGRYGVARDLKPSSEILLHLEAYRQRPDVRAVVHAHPVNAIALSIAGISLARCLIPEVIVNLGMIPTTEYAMPASAEGAAVIRDIVRRYDALILQRHGSVTVGRDIWEAYLNLEKLENVAEITFKLLLLGREQPFPPGTVEKLIEKREKHGLMLPGQREELEAACGVCQLSGRCPLPERTQG
jgi:L-fuculose-phosphate aldolase